MFICYELGCVFCCYVLGLSYGLNRVCDSCGAIVIRKSIANNPIRWSPSLWRFVWGNEIRRFWGTTIWVSCYGGLAKERIMTRLIRYGYTSIIHTHTYIHTAGLMWTLLELSDGRIYYVRRFVGRKFMLKHKLFLIIYFLIPGNILKIIMRFRPHSFYTSFIFTLILMALKDFWRKQLLPAKTNHKLP